MATIITGVEFAEPITHTILPVAEITRGQTRNGEVTSVRIVGFFPISQTEFTGLETSFSLSTGPVKVTSVRLPTSVAGERVPEYMVAEFNSHEANLEAWRGHGSFVSNEESGYYSQWVLPASAITYRHGLGILVGSLVRRLDVGTWSSPGNPVPPTASNGTIKWAASIPLTSNLECAFFDFNWVDLFSAKPPAGVDVASLTGLAIVPTTQPAGLPFKSTVMQHPMVGPNNTVIYTTVRIVKLKQEPAPGDYTFGFTIVYTDSHNRQASANVTLTLTVV